VNIAQIVEKCRNFYLSSKSFNGYPIGRLKRELGVSDGEAKKLLEELIRTDQVTVEFGNYHPNPHIKAFESLSSQAQLKLLSELEFGGHFCLYPSRSNLAGDPEIEKYSDEPYTRELAQGCGQLEYRVFDLAVLEHYRNDPRYYYWTDSIHGSISVRDEYYMSDQMAEKDQVLLQTFGFAYDDSMKRGVAVFLRYLADLSPEHQHIWSARELGAGYRLHPDYYRTSILGEWGERISIFDAFVSELKIVNEMVALMSRPPLFKDEFQEKPKGFEFLLRPTSKELQDFCLLLDKMMSENINKAFFSSELSLENEEVRRDGKIVISQKSTITLLDEWLGRKFRPEDPKDLQILVGAFRKVRNLRQKPAHAVNDNKFDQENFKKQREIIIEAYAAIRTLRLIFANHPAVVAGSPYISSELFEGKIWSF
jgi:hypothetical protein